MASIQRYLDAAVHFFFNRNGAVMVTKQAGQISIQRLQLGIATAAIAIGTSYGSVACAQTVPLGDLLLRGIQVLQVSNLSKQQEMQLGAQMHQNLLSKGTKLYTNAELNQYVQEIGQRLAVNSRRVPFRFYIVQSPSVNAFATMGGYVYITTGLLKAADNEAQVASVMAHEMGHIEKRHLLSQIQNAMLTRGLLATALGTDQNQLANMGAELLVSRPQSREDEYEADQEGLRLLRGANYATGAMPAFMRKLLRPGNSGPVFLSTHPAIPNRLKVLEQTIRTGPQNQCDMNAPPKSCGLDRTSYQARLQRNGLY
ncbi:MAG TPA: M48 family metallopeptidase [Stenomitos sp.]